MSDAYTTQMDAARKGIAIASIGNLLAPLYKVIPIKCDGYLNVDPGTMSREP